MKIACVHGVNVPPNEQTRFHETWVPAIERHFPDDDVECFPVSWGSVGLATVDWARLVWSVPWFNENVDRIQAQLDEIQPDVIVAHSMGTVMALATTYPLVSIGSPFSHPFLGRRIELAGLVKRRTGPAPQCIVNRDDEICALFGWMRTNKAVPYYNFVEVRVDAPRGFVVEHDPVLYLQTKSAGLAIAKAFEQGRRA